MKRVYLDEGWLDSWRYSYPYDLEEVYGEITNVGYANAYRTRARHTLSLLTDVLPRGARILDVAAAQGNFSIRLAEMGYDITWNDLREELVDYVRMKHERGRLSFAPGNIFDLKLSEQFDAVLITEVIEHVAHPDVFLARISTFLKPGGLVVMSTPNGAYFRNTLPTFSDCLDPAKYESIQFKPNSDGHIFLLHPDEVALLATRAGLILEQLSLFTNPLTAGHLKTNSLLHLLPRWAVDSVETASTRLPRFIRERTLIQFAARLRKPDSVAPYRRAD